MFKAKVVSIFCVVCPCLFALLLNCSALNSGKEQKSQIRRRCMVNCFHSGIENLEEPSRTRQGSCNVAVHDGCSLAITKVNASKYNGIPNQMQTPYYSNEFQILEHPLHYHHEKNTSRRRWFEFSASCALVFLLSCLIAVLSIWARTKKDK